MGLGISVRGERTRGEIRVVMGVKREGGRLIPMGVWADKSWEEIEEELRSKKPSDVKVPVVTIDGERGVLAVANVIVMRIYSPEEWRRYWANLMDIKGRCFVRSFHVSFNVLS
jgi:hypothetical protein